MKISVPAFGLMSGISSSLGMLPHLVIICHLLISKVPLESAAFLVFFTVVAKLAGEWLFCGFFEKRMDSEPKFKKWRLVVQEAFLSHPKTLTLFSLMLMDGFVDAVLITTALKMSQSIGWVFFSILGCQAIASPIQGYISDCLSQKKCLLFASTVAFLALSTTLSIVLGENAHEPGWRPLITFLGLSSFAPGTQIFFVLCGKGLFGNVLTLARASIAKSIQQKTVQQLVA